MTRRILDRATMPLLPLLAVLFALAVPAVAQQATQAQRNAIRQACPADYQRVCTAVPAGGKASFDCLVRNMAILSPPCQRAVKSVSASGAATAAAPLSSTATTRSAPSAAAAPAAPRLSPRQELAVLRQDCGGDYRTLCRGVPLGEGRAIACLRANAASLSPQCSEALNDAQRNR